MPESLTDHLVVPVANEEGARATARILSADESSPMLLNVQPPETDRDEDSSPAERGEAVVEELAERVRIKHMTDDTEIRVAEDAEQTIIDRAEEYDPLRVGATRSGAISQAVFGSLPETVGTEVDRTVVMARGPEESAMSAREALLRRAEV